MKKTHSLSIIITLLVTFIFILSGQEMAFAAGDFIKIAAGEAHSVALNNDGTVRTWGDNSYGILGDGTTTSRYQPTLVKGLSGVNAMDAGRNHTAVVKSDGTVWTWGNNGYGQLGDGTTTNRNTPVQVKGPGGSGYLTGIVAVAAGEFFTVAVKGSDGSVWTWGYNYYGQLGDGSTTTSYTPVQVKGPGGIGYLTGVSAVAAEGPFVLALKTDHYVWAWGANQAGTLGDGTLTTSYTPVQVKGLNGIGFLSNINSIAVGVSHSLALKNDGSAWAWGSNGHGELGIGTTGGYYPTPKQVNLLANVSSISGGWWYTVAVNYGYVYGWGDNSLGQLGNGTTTGSSEPTLAGTTYASMVAAGYNHALALGSLGTNLGWGYNYYGQIGDGSPSNLRTSPVPVLQPAILLSDDFGQSGDVSKWNNTAYATVSNGQLYLTNNQSMESKSGGAHWTDFVLEADVKISNSAAGLVFRKTDDNNLYMWQLNASTGNLKLHKKAIGIYTVLREVAAGIVTSTTYRVKIAAQGSTIKTYINGSLVDTTTDSTFTSGKVGFRQCAAEAAYFDNVQVYKSYTVPGIIQAEDFDEGVEGSAYHDDEPENTGGLYRNTGVDIGKDGSGGFSVGWTNPGEWLKYTVNIPSDGYYNIGFRVACIATGATFHLTYDGYDITGPMSVPNTGGYQTFQTVTKSGAYMTAGQHVLKLVIDTRSGDWGCGNYNYISIIKQPKDIPGLIQAEDFDEGYEGSTYHDIDSNNAGGAYRNTYVDIEACGDADGGHNVGWTSPGEWLKYTVNITSTGNYNIGFRVASIATGATFHLTSDDIDITGPMSVPNTGGYQTFQTVTKSGVYLTAGQHVLKLVFDTPSGDSGCGNFNYISIYPQL